MCLGIIIVKILLWVFLSFICVSAQNNSSEGCVLAAHQIFLPFILFKIVASNFSSGPILAFANFKFPKFLIFFAPKTLR